MDVPVPVAIVPIVAVPEVLKLPLTVNFSFGLVVPIPTLPPERILTASCSVLTRN